MTDSTLQLRRKIDSAVDLQSVVRTMRALAASNISDYEHSVQALAGYALAIDFGIGACLRQLRVDEAAPGPETLSATPGLIVFGSDQGLVGQFNEVVTDHALATLEPMPAGAELWVVGERAAARLIDAGRRLNAVYPVPNSVEGIAALIGRIQLDTESHPSQSATPHIVVLHNRPVAPAGYQPVGQRLLPFDARWRAERLAQAWPSGNLPEVLWNTPRTLRALIREFLFIAMYRACAESLASENAARLAAMQRADSNIDEMLGGLRGRFHQLRQRAIDEELSDVIAGYESLSASTGPR